MPWTTGLHQNYDKYWPGTRTQGTATFYVKLCQLFQWDTGVLSSVCSLFQWLCQPVSLLGSENKCWENITDCGEFWQYKIQIDNNQLFISCECLNHEPQTVAGCQKQLSKTCRMLDLRLPDEKVRKLIKLSTYCWYIQIETTMQCT